jgi:ankyrin repeat protein
LLARHLSVDNSVNMDHDTFMKESEQLINAHNSSDHYMAFKASCKFGLLYEAQILLQFRPEIDISANDDLIFREVCGQNELQTTNHILVAQWLLQIKPNINISADDDDAFRRACSNGHLAMAQLLLQLRPDINIGANEDDAFQKACSNGRTDVAQWLVSLAPNKYRITSQHPLTKMMQYEITPSPN